METRLTESTSEAAEFIKSGGLVAFPTETVYGLGADVFNENAVAKIFRAKQRPTDNPLIAHISDFEQIKLLAKEITPIAEKLIEKFFPGPLTLVLPKTERVPLIATANLETIGIRMPRHELARQFLHFCKTPVVAPSANLSGRPSPTDWKAVYEDLNGQIDCILIGEVTEIGLESTVVDCTLETPVILRPGAISLEELEKVFPKILLFSPSPGEPAKSPGLKHKHYSPKAEVILVKSPKDIEENVENSKAFIGLSNPSKGFDLMKVCKSVEEYAHEIFLFFRECDRRKINKIYCEEVEEKGIGLALMDRLRRAAIR
jgi:L-threonylcarbamoyladenylate synthase